MTEDELKIQIALGVFPKELITPQFIQECQNLRVLTLIARLWVSCTTSAHQYISNDDITSALLNHEIITPELRQYIITGRLYQKALKDVKTGKIRLNGRPPQYDYQRHLDKLTAMEEKLFGGRL